jgi:hypothetical protein
MTTAIVVNAELNEYPDHLTPHGGVIVSRNFTLLCLETRGFSDNLHNTTLPLA